MLWGCDVWLTYEFVNHGYNWLLCWIVLCFPLLISFCERQGQKRSFLFLLLLMAFGERQRKKKFFVIIWDRDCCEVVTFDWWISSLITDIIDCCNGLLLCFLLLMSFGERQGQKRSFLLILEVGIAVRLLRLIDL